MPSSSAPGTKLHVVVEDGRDDAGSAVGRGGDDPATGGVLLVHREGVEVDPVHDVERVGVALGGEVAMEPRRAPGHPKTARQHAFAVESALDARSHHRPQVQHAAADLVLRAPRALVGEHHLADRQALPPAGCQQLGAGAEGEGDRGVVERRPGPRPSPPRRRRTRHRPSRRCCSRSSAPLASYAAKVMPLGCAGRLLRRCMTRSSSMSKRIGRLPPRLSSPLGADLVDPGVGAVRVGRGGVLALEAEDHRLRGAVAVPGRAERAEQLGPDPYDVVEPALRGEPVGEELAGPHRPHGVGRRRADADGVEVERGQRHAIPPPSSKSDANSRLASTSQRAT